MVSLSSISKTELDTFRTTLVLKISSIFLQTHCGILIFSYLILTNSHKNYSLWYRSPQYPTQSLPLPKVCWSILKSAAFSVSILRVIGRSFEYTF